MRSSTSHLPSLLGSLLFIVGAVLFLSVALIMGVTSLSMLLSGESIQAQQTIVLVVSIFEALLLLAAAFISIQKFRQQPSVEKDASFSIRPSHAAASLLIAGLAILVGYQIGDNNSFNWLILPILTLPAVVLPLFILLGLGIRGIPLGSRWQSWNIFGIAMTLAPFILIFLEIFVIVLILVFVIAFLVTQPDFVTEMERLSRQIYLMGPDSEAAQNLLIPYITHPGVIAIALLFFAILVPMLEELFKPLGVWFFAKKITTPAQGFALGALSGAAYALIETLGVSAQTADWATLLLSRVGTGMLHITTSGLMGAGIVFAIRERKYLRLLGMYVLAVSLHGVWNGLAILYSFSMFTETIGQQSPLSGIRTSLMVAMAILALILFIILILSNRRMTASLPTATLEEPTP